MTLPTTHPVMKLLAHYGEAYHTLECAALQVDNVENATQDPQELCNCPWGAVRAWAEFGDLPLVSAEFSDIPEAFQANNEGYRQAIEDGVEFADETPFSETILTPEDAYPATLDAETLAALVLRPDFIGLKIAATKHEAHEH